MRKEDIKQDVLKFLMNECNLVFNPVNKEILELHVSKFAYKNLIRKLLED